MTFLTLLLAELVETASVVAHRAAGASRVLALSGTFSTLTAVFGILAASTGITGITAGGTRLLALSATSDLDRCASIARRVGETCLLTRRAFALAAHFDINTGSIAGILQTSARPSLALLLTVGLGTSTAGSDSATGAVVVHRAVPSHLALSTSAAGFFDI